MQAKVKTPFTEIVKAAQDAREACGGAPVEVSDTGRKVKIGAWPSKEQMDKLEMILMRIVSLQHKSDGSSN